jgi:hypothetical protein
MSFLVLDTLASKIPMQRKMGRWIQRVGLGLEEERDITSGIEDDIDQDPFTPSKHKPTRSRRIDVT